VEGTLRARNDCARCTNRIREDALGRDPDYPEPVILDELKPAPIVSGLLAHVVDHAFDFDDQLVLQAAEINHIRADRVLAAELETSWPLAKLLPEQAFGHRHFTA
jgi:hypothetical protein